MGVRAAGEFTRTGLNAIAWGLPAQHGPVHQFLE
jgi:hypothetical protein